LIGKRKSYRSGRGVHQSQPNQRDGEQKGGRRQAQSGKEGERSPRGEASLSEKKEKIKAFIYQLVYELLDIFIFI
jgi:hypothetical protein